LLFDLLSADNTLKLVTIVNWSPFCAENKAALLSLLLNKCGQKNKGSSPLQV